MIKKLFLYSCVFLCIIGLSACTSDIKNFQNEPESNKYSCYYKISSKNHLNKENLRKRTFYLFLPEQNDYTNTNLVVMLHGYGNSAWTFIRDTEFEKTAVPQNYAVLYISGAPNPQVKTSSSGWNYNYDEFGKADISFIADLTRFVQKKYKLSSKAYVVGFSNGAFMATKLAVEKSRLYNAVVSVGGMMPQAVWNHRKNHAVRFFQINGTKDDVTPMRLNNSARYNPNPAMEDVIDYWVKINKADSEPIEEELNKKIKIIKYENKVWWLLIDKYPHSWPSIRYCELNINDIILEFFESEVD